MDRFLIGLVISLGIVLGLHLAGVFEAPLPTRPPAPAPARAPAPVRYTLMTSVSPSGGGAISPSSGTYDSGTVVTLTATPSPGYQFDHWSGDVSGTSATLAITMNSNKNAIANFSRAGKIVFVSERDGNQEIYVMNIDGSNQINLSRNSANDWHPRWSPDGKRIVFVSSRDGNAEIYVMNADGSNPINLTNSSPNEYCPEWSPDGKSIVFVSDRDGNDEIYIMDTNGSNQTNLTKNPAPDSYPVWSPDGRRIAFISIRGDYPYSMFSLVYVMNANGTGVTRLEDPSLDLNTRYLTDWSPGGMYLVISKKPALVPIQLMLLEFKSGNTQVLKKQAFGGSFSPDGKQLVFSHVLDHNWEICILDISTGIVTRLTNDMAPDTNPDWSP